MPGALAPEVKLREVWAWSMYDFANSAYTTVVVTAVFGPGAVTLSLALIIVSNYFFGTGENLIAAFLPELANSGAMGRVSGWGWSFGYLGGLAALGICLFYITSSQAAGKSATEFVPVTMLITAAFFAAAAPTFLFLKERALPQPQTGNPWVRVKQTLQHSRQYGDLRRFLICIVFYQAGITTVVSLAAIYAEQAMKFTTQQTLTLILVVNITAALGAFAFGYLQDAIGHVRAVALTLVGWIIMVVLAGLAQSSISFWIAANLAGLCMGSSQAAGRAIVGYLAPPARLAEFFGLWGLAVKTASIFGPLTYGTMTWIFAGNHRLGIFVTGIYFVIGLLLLKTIDVERGRRAALA